MAVKKLSQIAPAGSPPALTDQLVGVSSGATDNLFTLSQVGKGVPLTVGSTPVVSGSGMILFDNAGILGETFVPIDANGNKTFYVATTGSDSNPGTIGSPFATLTHALVIASKFDYQLLYTPTINVANGTYTAAAGLPGAAIPPFVNLQQNNVGVSIVGNSASPSSVVIQAGTGGIYGIVQPIGCSANTVTVDGISFQGTVNPRNPPAGDLGGDFVCLSGTLQYNSIICNGAKPIVANGSGAIIQDNPAGGTLSINITAAGSNIANTVGYAFQAVNGGKYFTQAATITLLNGLNCRSAFLLSIDFSNMTFQPATFPTNGLTVTGTNLIAASFSAVFTNNASLSDIPPGTQAVPAVDNTVAFGFGFGDASLTLLDFNLIQFLLGQIFAGNWGVVKFSGASSPALARGMGVWAVDYDGTPKCITPEVVHVITQFDKTNDAVLANIPDLVVDILHSTVAADFCYQFNATLFTTSNVAGGVQASVGGTCTAAFIIYEGETTSGGSIVAQTRATALGTSVGAVTAVTAARINIQGLIKCATGGTLSIQFAQNVGNGTASSVLVGSYFAVQQVS